VDVVLVLDASSSMLRAAGDGGTKQAAVMRAARAFLDRFALAEGAGRVAVAAFNDRAWVVQPLTNDHTRLEAAVAQLPQLVAEGTRLDLGLTVGAAALGPAAPGRLQAMVFLTDGMPNRVPTPVGGGQQDDTVLSAAAAVRARGITVHTVGYGRPDAADLADRISPSLLIAIAGNAAGYHQTDDAGELVGVFMHLAAALGCVDGPGWP
jgi:Mg-chelatase subunit ChlD